MKHFATFILFIVTVCEVKAVTIFAASGSAVDVSNAVISAGFGGTVWVPDGTNIWDSSLAETGVSLFATNKCSILFRTNTASGFFLSCGGAYVTVSNFVFDATSGGPQANMMDIVGSNNCFRITHCQWLNSAQGLGTAFGVQIGTINANHYDGPYGVIDNCNFYFPGGVVYNYVNVRANGNQDHYTWSNSMTWGTTNCVMVENCNFSKPTENPVGGLVECDGGARICIRYCNITNVPQSTHGFASGAHDSTLQVEFYMNKWVDTDTGNTMPYAFWNRGGASICWSNTFITLDVFSLGKVFYFTAECANSNIITDCGPPEPTWQCEGCGTPALVYPAYQQPGQGVSPVNTIGLMPCYNWSNTLPALPVSAFYAYYVLGGGADSTFILSSRDVYTNDTMMPGYTPLTYPYPFTTNGQQAAVTTYNTTQPGLLTR